jgi:hypothetical protein
MVLEGDVDLATVVESLEGERPDRFEQSVRARVELAHHEALVDERRQHEVELARVDERRQRLQRAEVEARGEDGEMAEQTLFRFVEQRIARRRSSSGVGVGLARSAP